MKKKMLFALLMSACFMASCSDDDNDNGPKKPVEPSYEIVTFEDCSFAEKHHENIGASSDKEATKFISGGIEFSHMNYYGKKSGIWVADTCESSEWDAEYVGIPSNKYVICNKKENKFSGADNTQKYSVWAYDDYIGHMPKLQFAEGVMKEAVSLKVNNVAQYWHLMKAGLYTNPGFSNADNDFYDATFIGYNAVGEVTGSVTINMSDFRNGKTYIMEDWTEVDLTPLGMVNKIELKCQYSPKLANLLYSDAYSICVDEIKFISKNQETK